MHHSPDKRSNDTITLSLIGHSTVLINMYGKRILTDPVLFDKIGIKIAKRKIGMKRKSAVGLPIDQIHQLDYILLSHVHLDHRDRESLHALTKKFPEQIHFVCPRNTSKLLKSIKGKKSVTEMERGEEKTIAGVLIRAGETNHRGSLTPRARYRNYTPGHHKAKGYNSYCLSYQGKQIVFGGDSAYTDAYKALANDVDIALMPIGGYDPRIENHCTPEQAATMAEHMNAKRFVPIHFETFPLGNKNPKEPMERLVRALESHTTIKLAIDHIGGIFRYEE